jgi:hypothetical protein
VSVGKLSLEVGKLYATRDDPEPSAVFVFRVTHLVPGDTDEWDMFVCEPVSFDGNGMLYRFWRDGKFVGAMHKQSDLVREVKSLKFLERKKHKLWKQQAARMQDGTA